MSLCSAEPIGEEPANIPEGSVALIVLDQAGPTERYQGCGEWLG